MSKVVRLKSDPIHLRSWGALVALSFNKSAGSGEISMGFPEVTRFLDALLEWETTKPEPDSKVVEACELLRTSTFLSDIRITAEVPIAQHRVRLIPDILYSEYPKSEIDPDDSSGSDRGDP